jgi:uncharacterized protein (TIGR03435 family)
MKVSAIAIAASVLALSAAALPGQTPQALPQTSAAPKPAFEVTSVRPNKSGESNASVRVEPGGRVTARNQTVRNLIRNAWNLQPYQIVGGPDWISTDHFDILAKVADTDMGPDWRPRPEEMMLRMQSLLEDRFKLMTHRETRELPAYALIIARGDSRLGGKLKPHTGECGSAERAPANGQNCGTRVNLSPAVGRVTAVGITIETFARNLSGTTGRYVVDKTGLNGLFDLDLEFTPEQSTETTGASLFTALQEQLGLKLDSQRAPVNVLVIDSAAQPAPD